MAMDEALFRAINGLGSQFEMADWFMLAVAQPFNFLFPALLVFAYWFWADKRQAIVGSLTLAGVILINDFIGAQVKHVVSRVRPCRALEGVHQLTGCGETFSFPSNHAMNTAAAAAFAQVLYPASGWVTWPLVALIGFSRVYVGAHYVSDVVGAWALGGAFGAAAGLLLLRWKGFQGTRPETRGERQEA